VLQLSRQELQGAADQLKAWLDDIEADIADSIAADEAASNADAVAAAVDEAAKQEEGDVDGEETGGGSCSSATLRSWNAGATEDAAGTAEASAAADEQQEPEQQQQQKPQQPELVERLLAWCKSNGMEPDLQVFSVSGSEGGSPLGACRGHVALVSQLLDMLDEAGGCLVACAIIAVTVVCVCRGLRVVGARSAMHLLSQLLDMLEEAGEITTNACNKLFACLRRVLRFNELVVAAAGRDEQQLQRYA
jgi:hypothetical protein